MDDSEASLIFVIMFGGIGFLMGILIAEVFLHWTGNDVFLFGFVIGGIFALFHKGIMLFIIKLLA